MKKSFMLAIAAAAVFLSCEKEKAEKAENHCPVVAASAVPQIVKDSFSVRYPATTVTTWFNKDSVGYCAYFTTGGVEKLSQFANNGSFVQEQIEANQSGEHNDGTDTTATGGKVPAAGCECEIHSEKD
jgi:hypothetical protein